MLNDMLLSEFVGLKVVADGGEVEGHSKEVDKPGGPEGAVVAPEFTAYASDKHSQTYTGIP